MIADRENQPLPIERERGEAPAPPLDLLFVLARPKSPNRTPEQVIPDNIAHALQYGGDSMGFSRLQRLWLLQGGQCFYCDRECRLAPPVSAPRFATIDHIQPKSAGGPNRFENYVMACRRCNSLKSNLPADAFLAFAKFVGPAWLPEENAGKGTFAAFRSGVRHYAVTVMGHAESAHTSYRYRQPYKNSAKQKRNPRDFRETDDNG